jgi:hypothetical protein
LRARDTRIVAERQVIPKPLISQWRRPLRQDRKGNVRTVHRIPSRGVVSDDGRVARGGRCFVCGSASGEGDRTGAEQSEEK